MWAGFFCRQDVSITILGRTKEFSEVRGTSLMCNFGVRSRFLDVIYGVRLPNGSPEKISDAINYWRLFPSNKLFLGYQIQTNDFQQENPFILNH